MARSLNQGNLTLQTVLGGWSWDGDAQLGYLEDSVVKHNLYIVLNTYIMFMIVDVFVFCGIFQSIISR